ncbi:MAG: tyrosine-type recombinase/integrase [Caldilineaceae bacterium]|nr:tyrosine-type recombinase/integrase [Caldilineaceae bacterium]
MKISDALQGYWLTKELEFSDTTTPGYHRTFARFVVFMSDCDIEAVTSADIRRFLLHLKNDFGLSRRTVSDAWVPLSSLWTWAEIELGIPHAIRGKVKRPPFTKQVIRPFDEQDIQKLLAVLPVTATGAERPTATRDRALVLTLLDSGIRASELCALTVGDYTPQTGRLHIRHGKGDKARVVVVGVRTQKALWRWGTVRGAARSNAPLFPSTRGGGHLRRDTLKHLLTRLGKRAGVERVHPHRFRHTFAVTFLRNGGNAIMLQELLGHTDLSMVRNYVRLAEQDFGAARRQSPADNWRL